MSIPILAELNQETDRLFIAGSRFSKGDLRIKKYIAPLAKMGEKAPVFLKLSEQLSELTECAPEQSATKLIEIKSLLLSILNTQGDIGTIDNINTLNNAHTSIGETSITYMELAPVLEALRKSGSNRLEIVQEAYEKGIFNDPRTIKAAVDTLGDGNYELVNYLIDTVIPNMNTIVCGYLYDCFKVDGKSADANKLKAIYKTQNEEALHFVNECLEKGSDQVKIMAIDILSNHSEYQDLLINLLHEKKIIKEAAVNGLTKMDAEKGIDVLIDMFNAKNSKDEKMMQSAFAANTGVYLTQKLVLLSAQRYEAAKNNLDEKQAITKLYAVFATLINKKDEQIAALMEKVLTEYALDRINEILTKEELTSLGNIYDKSLTILYQTNFGNEFIWELFIKVQQGLSDKLLKKKTKAISGSLLLYAFYIGVARLDAEQYFDTFFKKDLYNSIYKLDRYAFMNVIQYAIDNKKTFSIRLANYFVGRKEFNNAIYVVSIADKKSISALLHHFDENMNKNVYSHENYLILQFAGQNKLPEFNNMYEKYCEKNHGFKREKDFLQQYLQNN